MELQAEFPSVPGFLSEVLTPEQRANVFLPSFNQWDFALGALSECALALSSLGSQVTLGFWADRTPLHDTGWTTSHALARLAFSPTIDERFRNALRISGLERRAFVSPPIHRWKALGEIESPPTFRRSDVRELSYRDAAVGRAILQVRPEPMTPTAEDHEWPHRWVRACSKSFAWAYDQTRALIEQRGITALITYNGRFLHDQAAAAAARHMGIPVLYYDLGGSDTAFDLTRDETHDWRALQDRMRRMYDGWPLAERDEIGAQWFLDRAHHADPRNAHFIDAQKPGSMVNLPVGKRVVVYFSSSSDEIAELDVDWSEYFVDQVNALRLIAQECRMREGYRLVVRSHPHKRRKPRRDVEEWLQVVDEVSPDLHLDPFSEVDSYELMRHADVVVTYGSTTGVEAAFAGKPVLVMGPSAYDELGCAIRVRTAEELGAALESPSAPDPQNAVMYGLMMKRRGFRNERIITDPGGTHSLGGVPLVDSRPIVRHGSHLIARWNRRYYNS